ncbi:M20/M25/M40 family metallo-hydrolase [Compostibacter hankyongensis]|uniref:M20/M25/M40 family metallo-hydrolase n=1 Tax=Compostibacter hankyongensis TaxID=1007089 RepID=A0ABP8FHS8_9BACT
MRCTVTAVFVFLLAGLKTGMAQELPDDSGISALVRAVSADSLRSYVEKLVSFGTRHTLSNRTDPERGIGAAQHWLLQQFRSFSAEGKGRLKVTLDTWQQPADGKRVNRPIVMANVMAVLPGTDTADHRVFIITAHLDSRRTNVMDSTGDAPGANDDASGVAALLEMARVMGSHPRAATIMWVAVSGEEQGLLGAAHLAEKMKQAHREVAAMINNDMIGQSTAGGTDLQDNTRVRVFSEGIPRAETPAQAALRRATGGENDSPSRELARYIKAAADRYVDNLTVKLIYRSDRFLRGGDHLPFTERGYTAVRITDYYENYTHQHQDVRKANGIIYGDLTRFMDFAYLRKNTGLNLAAVAELAAAPSVPQEVKMDVRELSNKTRLYWKAPAHGRVKGYYVLMRETDQPMWQRRFFTSSETLILPYSKDNYFFAVQAIGEDGSRSLPVFPAIGR